MYVRVRTGNHIVQTGISIFPFSELGKNPKLIDHWEASGRAADTSGRIQPGTVASWYSRGLNGKCTSSGRMMLGLNGVRTVRHIVWKDGAVDRWVSGRDGSIVRTADREPEIFWLVDRIFWIAESLARQQLYKQVVFSKHRMRPIILTNMLITYRLRKVN
jgi:hypothetical protein